MINSIDIVGNVRVKEIKRLKYFLAVLDSLSFLKDNSRLFINIEQGEALVKPVKKYLDKIGFPVVCISAQKDYYGKIYSGLLSKTSAEYILNLEDDHFCVLDDKEKLFRMINIADQHKVDIIPVTFFSLFRKIYAQAKPFYFDSVCKVYHYDKGMFEKLNYDQKSFIVGVNCIFRRDFAFEFWSKDVKSFRPHEFEMIGYQEDFSKILLMPEFEILRPVDSDHGMVNSCCIKNPDNKKWESILKNISMNGFPMKKITRSFLENTEISMANRIISKLKKISGR